MRRVVVTGLGIVCPLGNSVEEAWKNALAGKSGVRKIQSFDASEYSCQMKSVISIRAPMFPRRKPAASISSCCTALWPVPRRSRTAVSW